MSLQDGKSPFAHWAEIVTSEEKKEDYLDYVREWEKTIAAFLFFSPDKGVSLKRELRRTKEGEALEEGLNNIPFGVKDNIAVKGFPLTCGSKMLENMISPYTATAVEKLLCAGAVPVGKTNLDEFGMGSSNENSALGETNNPWDRTRVTGGSSGGSAAAVAAGEVPFALGSDTGGSVRQPAAFCGVYGLKPTYGTVSRYGLVAYASSLEVIGILSGNVEQVKQVYNTVRGYDPKDHSSLEYEMPEEVLKETYTVGIVKGEMDIQEEVKETFLETQERIKELGWTIKPIEIPHMDYTVPAYYTIATAEASANLARYTGIRYGHRPEGAATQEELVRASRTAGFGEEVKLRILLGTYVLRSGFQDQYYGRAQKVRTAIRNDFHRAYEDVDLILSPVFPVQAFPKGKTALDPFQQKLADRYTCSANLTGMPAFSFPTPLKKGLPVGMQFLAPPFHEERIFDAVTKLNKNVQLPRPSGVKDWGEG